MKVESLSVAKGSGNPEVFVAFFLLQFCKRLFVIWLMLVLDDVGDDFT